MSRNVWEGGWRACRPPVHTYSQLAPSRLTPHASRLTPHASRLTPHAARRTPHAAPLAPAPAAVEEALVESLEGDVHDQPNLVIRSLGLALYQVVHDVHASRLSGTEVGAESEPLA